MTPAELLHTIDPHHHPAPGICPSATPFPNGIWPTDVRPNRVPSTGKPVEAYIEEEGARLEEARREWKRLGWRTP